MMDDVGRDGSGRYPMDAVVAIYCSLAEVEQRFNSTQTTIKTLASTWMLAGFTGIALAIRGNGDASWLIPQQVAVVLITFLIVSGLFVLWVIDYRVYQMLLGSAFLAGLRMEWDYSFLPPMRALMMHAAGGQGMQRWLLSFYLIPMLILWGVAMAFALGVGSDEAFKIGQLQVSRLMLATVASVAHGLPISGIVLVGALTVKLRRRAELFDDIKFNSLFSDRGFDAGAIVKGYRPLTPPSAPSV